MIINEVELQLHRPRQLPLQPREVELQNQNNTKAVKTPGVYSVHVPGNKP